MERTRLVGLCDLLGGGRAGLFGLAFGAGACGRRTALELWRLRRGGAGVRGDGLSAGRFRPGLGDADGLRLVGAGGAVVGAGLARFPAIGQQSPGVGDGRAGECPARARTGRAGAVADAAGPARADRVVGAGGSAAVVAECGFTLAGVVLWGVGLRRRGRGAGQARLFPGAGNRFGRVCFGCGAVGVAVASGLAAASAARATGR